MKVEGYFAAASSTNPMVGIYLKGIQNPATTGKTDTFKISIKDNSNALIAEKLNDTYAMIKEQVASCSIVCKTCSGTETNCTSCENPSTSPILKDGFCLDRCGDGYFLLELTLKCYKCSASCATCYGYKSD